MARGRWYFESEGDVEGHGRNRSGREIEIDQIRLRTADGEELTLEPEEDGDRWQVTEGPDDIVGHRYRWG
jgi:hypothetical protein